MKMKPAYKDYLWGGSKLRDLYHKESNLETIAESWEISTHPDGLSVVANGEFAMQTLAEVYPLAEQAGNSLVLIKLIDAREPLSLQVHPNDEYALRTEGQLGKNEKWYILEAEQGAELILGFDEKYADISKDELRRLCDSGEILSATRRVQAKKGDCYLVPAGLIHAIGAGIVIAEVQQMSNVTYRVYDYGRTDSEGNPRELHIDKALDVIDPKAVSKKADSEILADWEYFKSRLLVIDSGASIEMKAERSYQCLLCTVGEAVLTYSTGDFTLRKGESCFVPAKTGDYTLTAAASRVEILLVES